MSHRIATPIYIVYGSKPYTTDSWYVSSYDIDIPSVRVRQGMKPLISDVYDTGALEQLGRASVQIVHDLKNQLNGLKLYATFLRKRMEKSDRPLDERETLEKLIGGLERAAADMAVLVRMGRQIELRPQPRVDLGRLILRSADAKADRITLTEEQGPVMADVDPQFLGEAFSTITTYAIGQLPNGSENKVRVSLRIDQSAVPPLAVIEWSGIRLGEDVEPFQSFAGSEGIRMSLAARIVSAHQGETSSHQQGLKIALPMNKAE